MGFGATVAICLGFGATVIICLGFVIVGVVTGVGA